MSVKSRLQCVHYIGKSETMNVRETFVIDLKQG